MKSQVSRGEIGNLRRKAVDVSHLLSQMSHPQRLLILCSLAEGEKSVGELESACEASQSAVSQFLKSMRLDGLVKSRRDGKQIFYMISDGRIFDLMKALYTIFCR